MLCKTCSYCDKCYRGEAFCSIEDRWVTKREAEDCEMYYSNEDAKFDEMEFDFYRRGEI